MDGTHKLSNAKEGGLKNPYTFIEIQYFLENNCENCMHIKAECNLSECSVLFFRGPCIKISNSSKKDLQAYEAVHISTGPSQ